MGTIHKTLLTALLATTVTGGASAAFASSTVTITAAGIYDPSYLNVYVPGTGGAPGGEQLLAATAIDLTVEISPSTTPKTLYVFCADLFRNISVGLNKQDPVGPLTYTTSVLTATSSGSTPGTGNPISTKVSEEIEDLAGIGVLDAETSVNGSNSLAEAAIQGAIWALEYNETVGAGNQISGLPSVNKLMVEDLANVAAAKTPATAIFSTTNGFVTSSQGFTSPGVPEPATWAMLIVGFGVVGATLRRRRAAPSAKVGAI